MLRASEMPSHVAVAMGLGDGKVSGIGKGGAEMNRGRSCSATQMLAGFSETSSPCSPTLASMTVVSWSPTKLACHNDEEDPAPVPAAEPADLPIIDTIAQGHRLAKPKELGLNVHGNSRPNTSMARLGRRVNPRF
jgi:hypothetical protein